MGLLKRIGQIALQATAIIAGVAPMVKAYAPQTGGLVDRVVDTSGQIATIVAQVEMVGQALALPGDQKLKGATIPVAQVILQSAVLAGRKIENEELFRRGCTKVTDGWADILNSLKGDVETENKVS